MSWGAGVSTLPSSPVRRISTIARFCTPRAATCGGPRSASGPPRLLFGAAWRIAPTVLLHCSWAAAGTVGAVGSVVAVAAVVAVGVVVAAGVAFFWSRWSGGARGVPVVLLTVLRGRQAHSGRAFSCGCVAGRGGGSAGANGAAGPVGALVAFRAHSLAIWAPIWGRSTLAALRSSFWRPVGAATVVGAACCAGAAERPCTAVGSLLHLGQRAPPLGLALPV